MGVSFIYWDPLEIPCHKLEMAEQLAKLTAHTKFGKYWDGFYFQWETLEMTRNKLEMPDLTAHQACQKKGGAGIYWQGKNGNSE